MDVEKLRKNYLPQKIGVLFIAEAKPDSPKRFFYYDKVADKDYLYIHLMRALYGYHKQDEQWLRDNKHEILKRFKSDGYYLIDAVDEINASTKPAARIKAIKANAGNKIAEIESLLSKYGSESTRIVIIKATVFTALYELLKNKFNVVNERPIYFPSHGNQGAFLAEMSKVSRALHLLERRVARLAATDTVMNLGFKRWHQLVLHTTVAGSINDLSDKDIATIEKAERELREDRQHLS